MQDFQRTVQNHNLKIFRNADIDVKNFTLDKYVREHNEIIIPLVVSSVPLFVQLSNLYIKDNIINLSESESALVELIEDYITSNLKTLIKNIKNKYTGLTLPKKFNYDSSVVNKFTQLAGLLGSLDNNFKVFDYDKKELSFNDFTNRHTNDVLYVNIIVEVYISVKMDGVIKSCYKLRQVKLTEPKRIIYSLDEYSFIDSENEDTYRLQNQERNQAQIEHERGREESENDESDDDSNNSDNDELSDDENEENYEDEDSDNDEDDDAIKAYFKSMK